MAWTGTSTPLAYVWTPGEGLVVPKPVTLKVSVQEFEVGVGDGLDVGVDGVGVGAAVGVGVGALVGVGVGVGEGLGEGLGVGAGCRRWSRRHLDKDGFDVSVTTHRYGYRVHVYLHSLVEKPMVECPVCVWDGLDRNLCTVGICVGAWRGIGCARTGHA